MVQELKWVDTIAGARRNHGNTTSQPLCFLSFLFFNLTSSNFSVQEERFTVASDHTK